MRTAKYLGIFSLFFLLSCMDDNNDSKKGEPSPPPPSAEQTQSQVQPEPSAPPARFARPIFIQPYENCKVVTDELSGSSREVCAQVAISGATEAGQKFSEFASCKDVRTQRFFAPLSPDNKAEADDPRLADPAFMKELAWVSQQIQSTGCACCHDSKSAAGTAKWDISAPYIWTAELSNRGAAILAGEVDSGTLGAFPPSENHGFDRSATGAPTTDVARMKAFFKAELERRRVTPEDIKQMEPLGGKNFIARLTLAPKACEAGAGVDESGKITWQGEPARYIYLLKPEAKAPIFPPNLDLPEGTLWRLDVAATANPLASGVIYGTTPTGTKQKFPANAEAPSLTKGESYWLYVLKDVGFPISSCIFTY